MNQTPNEIFRAIKPNKISADIAEQIRKAVFAGRLKPGDKLPVERELIKQLGVSKATIREALRSLEVLGFIKISKGVSGGAFVTEVDVKKVRDYFANFLLFKNLSIKNLTEVRLLLEPAIAEKAARTISKKDLKKLEEKVKQSDQVLEGNLEESDVEFHQFHYLLADLSGNPILSFVVNFVESLLIDIRSSLDGSKEFSRKVQRINPHRRIYEALAKRDAKKAREEMQKHVQEVERVILALKSRERSLIREEKAKEVQKRPRADEFLRAIRSVSDIQLGI